MANLVGTLHACDYCKRLMPCVVASGRDCNGDADGPDLCHVCRQEPDMDCDDCEDWKERDRG